jgi:hypothetical protein
MQESPTPQATSTEQSYGQFYAQANQDELEVKKLKDRLFATTAQLYDSNATTESKKFAVLGTLEEVRQFLFSYRDALKGEQENIMKDLKETIDTVRLVELEDEALIDIYQNIREPVTFTLSAVLGFRKKKVARYGWIPRLHERLQLQDNEITRKIVEDSKGIYIHSINN